MSKIIGDHRELINFRTKMQVVYFSKFKLIEVYAVLWECLNRNAIRIIAHSCSNIHTSREN